MGTLTEHFESTFPEGTDFSKHTDLECLLLELPQGSYKDPEVREGWAQTTEIDLSATFNQQYASECRLVRGRQFVRWKKDNTWGQWRELTP